jgi:hypothetical protein
VIIRISHSLSTHLFILLTTTSNNFKESKFLLNIQLNNAFLCRPSIEYFIIFNKIDLLSVCPSHCETCSPTGECCDPNCLGGCTSHITGRSSCFSCRGFLYNNKCVNKCPKHTYEVSQTNLILKIR